MKKKNRAFYRYFIPVIYAVFVYILWELTGTLVAYVVGKVMDNWEETLYSSYISMLFNEVLTFVIMFVLFRKKADFVRKKKICFLLHGEKEKWNLLCGSCVFPWIWSVPLPESAGGTELCRYDKTGIVCDLFWHVSGSTFYTDESFIHSGSCTWTL